MLPFKENRPMLEDNYAVSLRRLKSLKVKLDKTPDILQEYNDVIKKQLESDVIERAGSPVKFTCRIEQLFERESRPRSGWFSMQVQKHLDPTVA